MSLQIFYNRVYLEPVQHPYPFHPNFYLETGQGFINREDRSDAWAPPVLLLWETFDQSPGLVYFQNRYTQGQGFNKKFWSQYVWYKEDDNTIRCETEFWDIENGSQSYQTNFPANAFGWTRCQVAEFSNIDPSPAPESMLIWHDLPYYQAITGWPLGIAPLYGWLKFTIEQPLVLRPSTMVHPIGMVRGGVSPF